MIHRDTLDLKERPQTFAGVSPLSSYPNRKNDSFISGKARLHTSLVFLACCALAAVLLTSLAAFQEAQVLASTSPSSPLDSSRAMGPDPSLSYVPSALVASEEELAIPEPGQDRVDPGWRLALGVALIVLGLSLVVGGLFYLVRQ